MLIFFSGRIGKAGKAEKAGRIGVQAGRTIVGQVRRVGQVGRVGQVRRVGVRAARAIVEQVGRVSCTGDCGTGGTSELHGRLWDGWGCKKEIFICELKNNPYLCGCQN